MCDLHRRNFILNPNSALFIVLPVITFMYFGLVNKMKNENINFGNLDAEAFHEMLMKDPDAVLIDVRTPGENSLSRIPRSNLIDINNPSFAEEIEKLDKSKNYYLYCRSGVRSYHACNYMLKIGFKSVYNLKPGIIGWQGEIES